MMDQSGRVWKWAGAVLSVLCAALGVCYFLLIRLETPAPVTATDAGTIQAPASPGGETADLIRKPKTDSPGSAGSQPAMDLSRPETPTTSSREELKQPKPGEPERASKVVSQAENQPTRRNQAAGKSNSIDTAQSPIINSVRPLGIVEQADGRVQAVIPDGEWTRLVEEGEVLADRSRVLKVSADAVEILRPTSGPNVELARDSDAVPLPAKTKMAQTSPPADSSQRETIVRERADNATEEPPKKQARRSSGEELLPGLEEGAASYRTTPPRKLAAPGEPKLIESQPEAPQIPIENPASRPQASLGTVQHSDGQVESIVSDGQWVKLIPVGGDTPRALVQSPNRDAGAALAGSPINRSAANGQDPSPSQTDDSGHTKLATADAAGARSLGRIQNPELPIQDSIDPIGIVEWPGGRTQAIITRGDTIALVEDIKTVAEARRVLALIPPQDESGEYPKVYSPDLPGRRREDETTRLASIKDEPATRGPPVEDEGSLALPGEFTPRQPEDRSLADWGRAPPTPASSGAGRFEDELPGIENTATARIEPARSFDNLPSTGRGRSNGAEGGSVSEVRPVDMENPKPERPIAPPTLHNSELAPAKLKDEGPRASPEVLGVVCSLDGTTRAVVSFGKSVMVVGEGDILPDGSRVERVEMDGMTITPQWPPDSVGERVPESHPFVGDTHQNLSGPAGSELQTQPRLRDNPKYSRR